MNSDIYQNHINLFHKAQNLALLGDNVTAKKVLSHSYLSNIENIREVDPFWPNYVLSTYCYLNSDILTLFSNTFFCGPNSNVVFRLLHGLISRGYPKYDEDYLIY